MWLVLWTLSFVLCPMSYVLYPMSYVLCPMSCVLCFFFLWWPTVSERHIAPRVGEPVLLHVGRSRAWCARAGAVGEHRRPWGDKPPLPWVFGAVVVCRLSSAPPASRSPPLPRVVVGWGGAPTGGCCPVLSTTALQDLGRQLQRHPTHFLFLFFFGWVVAARCVWFALLGRTLCLSDAVGHHKKIKLK